MNRDNWKRTWSRAFVSDKDSTEEQQLKEAEFYIEYIESRLVVTYWDRYPLFRDFRVSYRCQTAYKNSIRKCRELIPTLD